MTRTLPLLAERTLEQEYYGVEASAGARVPRREARGSAEHGGRSLSRFVLPILDLTRMVSLLKQRCV
jgi:hypothetical protein